MRNGRLVGVAETSKERAEWHRLQQNNISILSLLKRKEWPQCHRESSWQLRQSHLCQIKKEQSRLFRAPDCREERVKVSERRTLAREGRIRAGACREKDWLYSEGWQISRRRRRAGKESLRRESRRKHDQVSGRKSSRGRSAELDRRDDVVVRASAS